MAVDLSGDDFSVLTKRTEGGAYALIEEYTGTNTTCDNLYDDDSGGNGQAQIKKYVVANKEYLAIIAFYDPDETGQFSISSSFS